MTSIEIIAHPIDIENSGHVPLYVSKYPVGIFGYYRYRFLIFNAEEVLQFRASPFYTEIETALLSYYKESFFTVMLNLFFEVRIGYVPERYEIFSFENGKRRYYPIFNGEYLHTREQEERILELDPNLLLGYYPVSANPLIWKYHSLEEPLRFEGACIVRDEGLLEVGNRLWSNIQQSKDRVNYQLAIGNSQDELIFTSCSK